MNKSTFLSVVFSAAFVLAISAQPSLPTKDLSTNPAIGATTLNYGTGTRQMSTDNSSFIPTGDYTVEIKARLLSTATKGFLLETRDSQRNGLRFLLNSNGLYNTSLLNYTDSLKPVAVSTDPNSNNDFHVFRFAVQGTNVYIYRDGIYVATNTIQSIYNDNYMKDENGGFESTDLSMWNLTVTGEGRTTTAGQFYDGAAGLLLINTDQSTIVATLTINGLKPATSYSMSILAKYISKTTNNGNLRYELKLGHYDGTGAFVQTNSGNVNNNIVSFPTNTMTPASATWTPNYKSFITGATDSVAQLCFSGWNGSNTYALDDIVLYETEATPTLGQPIGTNLVANGSFTTNVTGWPNGGWPLGAINWSVNHGGELQLKENAWVNQQDGTYSVPATVLPNSVYTLSANISQRVVPTGAFRYINLVDGGTMAQVAYTPTAGLDANYYYNTTPPLVTGPASTTVNMQFTTRTNSNTGSPVVIMTLDSVSLQQYAATFPTYLKYGKTYQSEALDCEVAYINYDLTGAYAPVNLSTGINSSVNDENGIYVSEGKICINGRIAPDARLNIFNTTGQLMYSTALQSNNKQLNVNLPAGIYMTALTNAGKTSIKKIILN